MNVNKFKKKGVKKTLFLKGCLFVICKFICVFVCLGAGNVVHRSSADPEPGHSRCLYSFRQLAQQALSDGLLQGRPQPCQCTHTLTLAHKHTHTSIRIAYDLLRHRSLLFASDCLYLMIAKVRCLPF